MEKNNLQHMLFKKFKILFNFIFLEWNNAYNYRVYIGIIISFLY